MKITLSASEVKLAKQLTQLMQSFTTTVKVEVDVVKENAKFTNEEDGGVSLNINENFIEEVLRQGTKTILMLAPMLKGLYDTLKFIGTDFDAMMRSYFPVDPKCKFKMTQDNVTAYEISTSIEKGVVIEIGNCYGSVREQMIRDLATAAGKYEDAYNAASNAPETQIKFDMIRRELETQILLLKSK